METETAALDELKSKHIPFQLITTSIPISNLNEAAREREQSPENIVKSILFRLPNSEFVMVLICANSRISWTKLRKYLKTQRITTANPDDVQQVTGYEVGGVSPFGIPSTIRKLLDEEVLKQAEISCGSGRKGTSIRMAIADFLQALENVEIGEFALR